MSFEDGEYMLFADTSDVISFSDNYHTVREGDNLINIAYQYYGDSGNWGLIARANKIINPFTGIKPGDRIIIP